jgi:glycosyltransferase involved in cell wall biosynthesis
VTDRLHVAYVTLYDPRDVMLASGTGHGILRALEGAGATMECLGPLRPLYDPVNVVRHIWEKKVRRRVDHAHRDPGFLRHYARQVERKLARSQAQVVLGSGGLPLAYLETDLPIVLWTDCTFAGLRGYYDAYTNLSPRTISNGERAEQSLFDRLAMAIFPSPWAADSAVEHYGFDRAKIVLVARGSNVPGEESERAVERLVDARPRDRCRLLFIGVDWRRKGGDIAVAAAAALERRGIPTELVVVGAPPPGAAPPFVTALGRIRKDEDGGLARIVDLYRGAHFLILPTRADAFGIVFGEAAAYGVPSIATRTGGTPAAVRDGITGRLLDPADPGERYADAIETIFRDPAAYRAFALAAWRDFRDRLNWPAVGRQARAALDDLVAGRR